MSSNTFWGSLLLLVADFNTILFSNIHQSMPTPTFLAQTHNHTQIRAAAGQSEGAKPEDERNDSTGGGALLLFQVVKTNADANRCDTFGLCLWPWAQTSQLLGQFLPSNCLQRHLMHSTPPMFKTNDDLRSVIMYH